MPGEEQSGFDFVSHGKAAVAEYLKVQRFYADLASVIARVIEDCRKRRLINVHSVQHRAKDATSFGRKAAVEGVLDFVFEA